MAKNINAKDRAIINQFPDATPHELLTKHGLSTQAYGVLVAEQEENAQASLLGKKVILPDVSHVLQPKTQAQPTSGINGDKVRLVLREGGNGTVMGRSHAEKMANRYPKLYKIMPA